MARSADKSQPLYDDSDPDTEPETFKPQRNGTRKRLSEAYNPDNDASFASDSGVRAQKSSVDINDDAAEKRRRRKSTKIAVPENAHAGPSSEGNDEVDKSRTIKQKQQLTTVAPLAPPEKESIDILSSKFEEWMKLTTDNKITAANTWEFALIDYFHEMSLLRNTDDNTINFQRASCTLDGCVKIWTSRVDSVGTETAKLASNLASGGTMDEDEEAGSDDPDREQTKQKKKRASRRENNLSDASQLRNKKPDLEFSVDPLFRKTCADFDEGGAQGLLMNHLSLGVGQDGSLRVVFDASDSISKEDEDDLHEPEDLIDLTQLRAEFIPDLDGLQSKAISQELSDFSFTQNPLMNDDTTFFQDDTIADGFDDDDDDGFEAMMVDGAPPVEDFFVGDDAVGDDYGAGMMDGEDLGDANSNGSVGPMGNGQGGTEQFVPFDPRHAPNQRDLMLAMNTEDGGGMMDYFDNTFLQNWAGPEHWKMRKPIRRPDADTAPKVAKPRKEKKEPNRIDFLTPSDPGKSWKIIADELFAPPSKGASINLPGTSAAAKKRKAKDEKKRDNHCLPDDMHFSSRQLVTLFLKPKFSLKMRGQRAPAPTNAEGEVDENFWAQAAADQAAGRSGGNDMDDTAAGDAIPFNTQFFHDDYDDGPGFDDAYDGDGGDGGAIDPGEQDLLAATQGQTRRVKPEAVRFTKRAKRVDVRKLKENIWKGLDIAVPPPKNADDERMDIDEDEPLLTSPTEARQFTSVISNLQRSYPRDKMEEISTSFCFICLLHLANEQGLKLENSATSSSNSDGSTDTKIGNIWDLKVYRDPEAAQTV
ncbi:condensin complex subunit 2/barren [Lentinula edodes]|uniref:condensin complex subunit 2/barren n=1 Tax=Lentinula edodes TaxID=5353 RepID=UPI001E8E978C|nr:condensin complex subunit 2/barren [Lentinula edodes]KAH7872991.1 condensin complex subunit 2/barren [Lentinula edodes]